jgi:hypothetical protein
VGNETGRVRLDEQRDQPWVFSRGDLVVTRRAATSSSLTALQHQLTSTKSRAVPASAILCAPRFHMLDAPVGKSVDNFAPKPSLQRLAGVRRPAGVVPRHW